MSGNWDDSDDDWDKSDDELDARLNLLKVTPATTAATATTSKFEDEEEDLAVIEKEKQEKLNKIKLKSKGNALAEKKKAEENRKEEEEIARKAMELEAEMELQMTPQQRREMQLQRAEEADNALTDDLFGITKSSVADRQVGADGKVMQAGDTVKMTDLKDHLKHARKVSQCLKGHGKVHLTAAFIKECIQESKESLDEDAIGDIIKVCNVIKNELAAAAKQKKKGQAQKSKKKDKAEAARVKKLADELYGANDQNDEYDDYGAQYEDDFF